MGISAPVRARLFATTIATALLSGALPRRHLHTVTGAAVMV